MFTFCKRSYHFYLELCFVDCVSAIINLKIRQTIFTLTTSVALKGAKIIFFFEFEDLVNNIYIDTSLGLAL